MFESVDHLFAGPRIQAARDRQKSYADVRRKPLEFQVGDKVMLKVSPWKGVICFGKRGKLNPRTCGNYGPRGQAVEAKPHFYHQGSIELQERPIIYVGTRGSISEEVSAPVRKPRIFAKYHDLSFRDKALLTEEDCDNLQFQTLGGRGGESFWEGGDDFGVDVLRFHTCLTDILGFLEKLEWWFEQDIDKEEERFEGDEDGGEV
ncbi:hypothetical protein Tco_0618813 [Tanacetum coccineum]